MKLGFWNRLAVVAFVVGVFAIPTWYVWSGNAQLWELRQSAFDTCVAAAEARKDATGYDVCHKSLMNEDRITLGWSHWREAFWGSIMGLAIGYLLIAGIVQTVKWVWRGRARK